MNHFKKIRQEIEVEIQQVNDWVEAAIQDGWSNKPTYEHENIDTASTMEKDGFTAHILRRYYEHNNRYEYVITIWGPDELQIKVPFPYNWKAMQAALRQCHYCRAQDVETTRISFAGRCCLKCRSDKKLTSKLEYPGWAN